MDHQAEASMRTPELSRPVRTALGLLLIALLCGFAAGPSRGASLMFRVPTYQVGEGSIQSTAMAVADFNGDGRSDLAVASASTSASVSVLLGRDDGTFGPQIPLE